MGAISSTDYELLPKVGPVPAPDRRQGRSHWLVHWVKNPARLSPAHAHAELHVQARIRRRPSRPICSTPRKTTARPGSRATPLRAASIRTTRRSSPTARSWWTASAAAAATASRRRRVPGEAGREQGHRAESLQRRGKDRRAVDLLLDSSNPRGYSPVARMPSLRLSDDGSAGDHLVPAHPGTEKPDAAGAAGKAAPTPRTSPPARRWSASTAASAATTSPAWRTSRASASSSPTFGSKPPRGAVLREPHRYPAHLGRLDVQQAEDSRGPMPPSASSS